MQAFAAALAALFLRPANRILDILPARAARRGKGLLHRF
jgi:hypothetical protein